MLKLKKNKHVPDSKTACLVIKFITDFKNLLLVHLHKPLMHNTANIAKHSIAVEDILTTTEKQFLIFKMKTS